MEVFWERHYSMQFNFIIYSVKNNPRIILIRTLFYMFNPANVTPYTVVYSRLWDLGFKEFRI